MEQYSLPPVMVVNKPKENDAYYLTVTDLKDTDETDDDIEVIKENISTICPYTRCVMKTPVRNKICGHTFDRNAIIDYLKLSRFPRCPIAGCSNIKRLEASDFEINTMLKMHIDNITK